MGAGMEVEPGYTLTFHLDPWCHWPFIEWCCFVQVVRCRRCSLLWRLKIVMWRIFTEQRHAGIDLGFEWRSNNLLPSRDVCQSTQSNISISDRPDGADKQGWILFISPVRLLYIYFFINSRSGVCFYALDSRFRCVSHVITSVMHSCNYSAVISRPADFWLLKVQ